MNDIYAVVDNNVVINVIIWDGISEWKPEAGNLVPLNGDAGIGWSYSDGVFTAPPPPERSHNALVAEAELQKSALLTVANNAIAPLQDAVDLEMVTDDEQALLLAWKKYRVLLNRVDTSAAPEIEWPTQPGEWAS
ncbi:tail fiber assembly protein [Escherichia coli]|nr:tail fiber assembly protein [Escherichia coli]ELA5859465.1 tail fiber assembly protein [Escherichia coli]ELY8250898.1 tail fiber assembly protein [Escherichia coli]HCK2306682.1 tail fiber assembly protein [Escherichia coli]